MTTRMRKTFHFVFNSIRFPLLLLSYLKMPTGDQLQLFGLGSMYLLPQRVLSFSKILEWGVLGGNPRRRRAEKRAGCGPWEGWLGQEMPSSFLGKKDPWPADWVSVGEEHGVPRLGLGSHSAAAVGRIRKVQG